jgi:hypothetical protein
MINIAKDLVLALTDFLDQIVINSVFVRMEECVTVKEDATVLQDLLVFIVKVSAPKVNLVIIVDLLVIAMVESVIM